MFHIYFYAKLSMRFFVSLFDLYILNPLKNKNINCQQWYIFNNFLCDTDFREVQLYFLNLDIDNEQYRHLPEIADAINFFYNFVYLIGIHHIWLRKFDLHSVLQIFLLINCVMKLVRLYFHMFNIILHFCPIFANLTSLWCFLGVET